MYLRHAYYTYWWEPCTTCECRHGIKLQTKTTYFIMSILTHHNSYSIIQRSHTYLPSRLIDYPSYNLFMLGNGDIISIVLNVELSSIDPW